MLGRRRAFAVEPRGGGRGESPPPGGQSLRPSADPHPRPRLRPGRATSPRGLSSDRAWPWETLSVGVKSAAPPSLSPRTPALGPAPPAPPLQPCDGPCAAAAPALCRGGGGEGRVGGLAAPCLPSPGAAWETWRALHPRQSVSAPQYQLERPDGRRAWHQVTMGDKATAPPTPYFPFFCLSFFFSTLQSPHSFSLKRTKAPPGRGYYFKLLPRPPLQESSSASPCQAAAQASVSVPFPSP